MYQYYVYIMTNYRYGTLYVGLTNDILRRTLEHKRGIYPDAFTKRYLLNRLVYFEMTHSLAQAAAYEHRLKRWRRTWKYDLIEKHNPLWADLYYSLYR